MVAEKILPEEVAMPFVDRAADDAATGLLAELFAADALTVARPIEAGLT